MQVQQLQHGIESDLSRLRANGPQQLQLAKSTSSDLNGFDGSELVDTWLLEDDVQQLPVDEEDVERQKELSIGALVLQQTADIQQGKSQKLNLRLNHHLLELSMKAGEAVGNSGRERWRNALEITRTRSSTKAYNSEFERCESCTVIPPNSKFRIAWDMASAGMILMDAFLLPICLAWNLTLTPFPTPLVDSHVALHIFASVSLIFWPIDSWRNGGEMQTVAAISPGNSTGDPSHVCLLRHPFPPLTVSPVQQQIPRTSILVLQRASSCRVF